MSQKMEVEKSLKIVKIGYINGVPDLKPATCVKFSDGRIIRWYYGGFMQVPEFDEIEDSSEIEWFDFDDVEIFPLAS